MIGKPRTRRDEDLMRGRPEWETQEHRPVSTEFTIHRACILPSIYDLLKSVSLRLTCVLAAPSAPAARRHLCLPIRHVRLYQNTPERVRRPAASHPARALLRFQTITSCPKLSSRVAMAAPILPMPAIPIFNCRSRGLFPEPYVDTSGGVESN